VEEDEWDARSLREVWEEEAEEAEPCRELEVDGGEEFSIPGIDMLAARGDVAVVAIGRESNDS
jgi:hypothetical protein